MPVETKIVQWKLELANSNLSLNCGHHVNGCLSQAQTAVYFNVDTH